MSAGTTSKPQAAPAPCLYATSIDVHGHCRTLSLLPHCSYSKGSLPTCNPLDPAKPMSSPAAISRSCPQVQMFLLNNQVGAFAAPGKDGMQHKRYDMTS